MSLTSQVQKKISLERSYYPEINKIFSRMQRDFKISVITTGLPPDANRYKAWWLGAIEKHYIRVQKAFRGEAIRSSKQMTDEEKEELTIAALLKWREDNVETQASFITQTNNKDQSKALLLAREALIEMDTQTPSNEELAIAAAAILERRYLARTENIGISQTQAAAESTKYIEAEIESDQIPTILGTQVIVSKTNKVWNTVGDRKVRDIHKAVNGLQVNLNEPFIVNNQLLMFPGDSSMGATADNVNNCRCVAMYLL